jgi:phosphatidate cytidylyltransferase
MTPDQRPVGAFSDPDLVRRFVSAIILAPLTVVAAWLGGWLFVVFWLAASLVVLYEWNRLVQSQHNVALYACEVAVLTATVLALHLARNPALALVAMGLGLGIALAIARAGERRWSAVGVVYAAAVVAGPVILRDDPQFGFAAILWLFAVVWGTDVGAYFAGRTFGGPKLWARMSPKKTWSGFIGGILVGVALAALVLSFFSISPRPGLLIFSAVIAAISQGGDLFESFVKRRFDAKDAGSIIPGHGGVMDRLDGFLVAGMAAAMFGLIRGGIDAPASGILVW